MTRENEDFELESVPSDNPALLIQEGDFGPLPTKWEHLNASRDLLKRIIPSVGRLEDASTNRLFGTAFVAGQGILMTNAHVVRNFARPAGDEWEFNPGVTQVRIDFRGEHEQATPSTVRVDGVIGIHTRYDLALLRFTPPTDHPVKALILNREEPTPATRNRDVVVIGYPDLDSQVTDAQVQDTFQNILGVKRLQPGRITGLQGSPSVLSHNCSTMGGNSGSCVIDVATGYVFALHFQGLGTTNLAVPLWAVAQDPLVKNLNWVRKRRATRT